MVNYSDEEVIKKAVDNKEILDYIPTNQKYNSTMEDMLIHMHGQGFITKEEEDRFESIPSYITEEDIIVWEAQHLLYEASFIETYPEAKGFVLKKEIK